MAFTLHPTLAKDSILAAKVGPLQVRLVDDARFFCLLIVPETTATAMHDLDDKITIFSKSPSLSVITGQHRPVAELMIPASSLGSSPREMPRFIASEVPIIVTCKFRK